MQSPVKAIPAALEAEKAVLGSILLDPDAMGKIVGKLTPQDFFSEKNAVVYEAAYNLYHRREPIDFVILSNELQRTQRDDSIDGVGYLLDLANGVATALYVEHYATLVEEAAKRRRYIALANKIAELAYDESKDLGDVTSEVQAQTFTATTSKGVKGLRQIGEATHKTVASIQKAMENQGTPLGVPTGFTMLDRLMGGLYPSDLIILAARPGMGKSALAFTIAKYAAQQSFGVAVFSMEMSDDQFIRRLLSMETMIDGHDLRTGYLNQEAFKKVSEKASKLATLPLYLDDSPNLNIAYIGAECRKIKASVGLDLVVVDYMQLMASAGKQENRHQELSLISRGLKSLAKELNVPVVALSQLSRAVESRSDKRPMLSDLRESGAIEQDADEVIFIYRDDYYNDESKQENIAELIIAKHRHGATDKVYLFFRKELTQFKELELTSNGNDQNPSDQPAFDY